MLINNDIIKLVRGENCFDFLRYLFALSLIIAHFCTITGTEQFWFITGGMRVKAFFTITGFLVTYSFLRCDCRLRTYAVKRAARILPAYICCIIFCIMLGWYVSSLGTQTFFSSAQTWKYALSNLFMLNWIEPELPCTFQSNVVPQMNGSLWSMKLEALFYVAVPFLVWMIKMVKSKCMMLIVMMLCVGVYAWLPVQLQYSVYFLSGMVLLLYFDSFCRYSKYILMLSVLSEVVLYVFYGTLSAEIASSIEPITFSSIIIGVAYYAKPLNFFRRFDNVTYGLYLYHFPIIQALILFGLLDYDVRICFFVTIVLTSIMAVLSWKLVEKPLMDKARKNN